MASLRTVAEAYACALDLRLTPAAEAEAWVERQMDALERPPIQLIEACGASGSVQRLVDALRQLPGDLDRPTVVRQCFWHALQSLRRDHSMVRPIALWLFRLAVDNEAPSAGAESLMYWFDDELDLIAMGHAASTSTVEQVVRAMEELLEQHGERPN